MALVIWHVQDATGQPLDGAIVAGVGDTLGAWAATTNRCGDAITELGADHYAISVSHPSAQTRELPADIADCGVITVGLEPKPAPPRPPTPAIVPVYADGPIFRIASGPDAGQAWRWKFVTAFKAAERWAAGEDLSAFVDWTVQVGARGWRVFCQHSYLNSWAPDWPAQNWMLPIEAVRPFVDWCAGEGLYVELVCLCDCQAEAHGQSTDEQVARVRDILEAVRGAANAFVEIANEPSENGVDPTVIADALGLWDSRPCLMALGLYPITGQEPNFPALDYIGDHPPRKPTWPIEAGKVGYYQYEQCGVVCLSDEPVKFSEPPGDPQHDPEATECSWETSPNNAEDGGGGFGIGSAGATFHCSAGIATILPGPLQTECATRYFAAMDHFPADAFCGDYSHDGAPGHPLAPINDETIVGEVASRVSGAVSYAVAAQPTTAWVPTAVDGWQFTWRRGNRGTLMALAR